MKTPPACEKTAARKYVQDGPAVTGEALPQA